jgi:hypothetical protein
MTAAGIRPGAPGTIVCTPHGMPRAPYEGAGRGAREEQCTDHEREHADDRRAGRADEQAEDSLEAATHRPAVASAERREQAEGRDGESGTEGLHVHDRAARHHERADDEEGDRRDVGSGPDRRGEPVDDPAPGHPAAPAQVKDRRQKDSECQQPEADQLGMLRVLRLALALLRANARRQARFQGAFLLPARRHARLLRRRAVGSYAKASLSLRVKGRRFAGNVRRRSPRTPVVSALRSCFLRSGHGR